MTDFVRAVDLDGVGDTMRHVKLEMAKAVAIGLLREDFDETICKMKVKSWCINQGLTDEDAKAAVARAVEYHGGE